MMLHWRNRGYAWSYCGSITNLDFVAFQKGGNTRTAFGAKQNKVDV